MNTIIQVGDEVLRKIAKPVPQDMFNTKELKDIVDNMLQVLDTQPDGVALAAPQISISYRIFVVRYDRLVTPVSDDDTVPDPSIGIFINPKIIRTARKSEKMEEGCLSVRDIYGMVRRLNRATILAHTIEGVAFRRDGGGILAQVFQHEVDHLDGILFIDHTDELYRINRDDNTIHHE
ncbi:MAG TPA: peptide deformylase [Candidatus Kaiserbacteria bacterium]|nr:peptide deformylase [Candidatus Kaiserbacteria bacterium]